ncbi:YebG family protein [Desulfospira joergensenii]|uniref:YebG family protein n=1 Tax=Desulfospira joergensenii TaxID=53329 RepID=UPI00048702D7|nr:YebG family protein [Desulfospira joergensenii]
MAVIVKYIVVRNGEEKMTFATKKEADAYDKMLDIADNLFEFLETSKIKLNETQMEAVSLLFAQNRDDLIPILRGTKPKKAPATPKTAAAGKENPKPKGTKSKK